MFFQLSIPPHTRVGIYHQVLPTFNKKEHPQNWMVKPPLNVKNLNYAKSKIQIRISRYFLKCCFLFILKYILHLSANALISLFSLRLLMKFVSHLGNPKWVCKGFNKINSHSHSLSLKLKSKWCKQFRLEVIIKCFCFFFSHPVH